jgi:nicotinate-nucleotide--dimethylbenzimidazole phosphoribosyltransferase
LRRGDYGKTRKQQVIDESVQMHFGFVVQPPAPLEILRCVGGLEIAAMIGFVLRAASLRMTEICDGLISTAAAALAYALAPALRDYLFAGHRYEEPWHQYLLRSMGLRPILDLGMRLVKGLGAVLAMPLIESSVKLFTEMATFSSAGVSTASE